MNTSAPTQFSDFGSADPLEDTAENRAIALSFLQHLAGEVSKGNVDLPCFPGVVVKISLALSDPTTTSDRVETIVGAEPRLAARILQTANSAAFNSSGKQLHDLRSAITRLGQQMVQGVAMNYAVQQMKTEASLKSISEPLNFLWKRSIEVASISKLLAQRCKVRADEAFLTGLLHGMGKLYILVRATTRPDGMGSARSVIDLIAGWHASIGKAVLESWGFSEEMCDAINDQADFDRRWKHAAALTDVLIAAIVLADALHSPAPRSIGKQGVNAFMSIGVSPADCEQILVSAEEQIRLVLEALA
jgi:HD-like signal output (HDOD) protein